VDLKIWQQVRDELQKAVPFNVIDSVLGRGFFYARPLNQKHMR
jgi:hypothetical protein